MLSIPGAGEDAAATGDLDITEDVRIGGALIVNGTAEPASLIDAAGLDRAFDIRGFIVAEIGAVALRNGFALVGDGGGILNALGTLKLSEVDVTDNAVGGIGFGGSGGGIYNGGTITAEHVRIVRNSAPADAGGGILNAGSLTMRYGELLENEAVSAGAIFNSQGVTDAEFLYLAHNRAGIGGGIENRGSFSLAAATLRANSADFGAGIANAGVFEIVDTTISNNAASTTGGGIANGALAGTFMPGDAPPPPGRLALASQALEFTVSLSNSTVSGNSARFGGGIEPASGRPHFGTSR